MAPDIASRVLMSDRDTDDDTPEPGTAALYVKDDALYIRFSDGAIYGLVMSPIPANRRDA